MRSGPRLPAPVHAVRQIIVPDRALLKNAGWYRAAGAEIWSGAGASPQARLLAAPALRGPHAVAALPRDAWVETNVYLERLPPARLPLVRVHRRAAITAAQGREAGRQYTRPSPGRGE